MRGVRLGRTKIRLHGALPFSHGLQCPAQFVRPRRLLRHQFQRTSECVCRGGEVTLRPKGLAAGKVEGPIAGFAPDRAVEVDESEVETAFRGVDQSRQIVGVGMTGILCKHGAVDFPGLYEIPGGLHFEPLPHARAEFCGASTLVLEPLEHDGLALLNVLRSGAPGGVPRRGRCRDRLLEESLELLHDLPVLEQHVRSR